MEAQRFTFGKGERSTHYLYINPLAADARGLADGDMARVSASGKSIEMPVRCDENMMPGSMEPWSEMSHMKRVLAEAVRVEATTDVETIKALIN